MRTFVLLLLCMAALAGCLSQEPTSGPDPAGDAARSPTEPHAIPAEDSIDEAPTEPGPSPADGEGSGSGGADAPPTEVYVAGKQRHDFQHQGMDRYLQYYMPPGVEVGQEMKMLVLLHAGTAGPNHVLRVTEIEAFADAHQFVVLTPSGLPDAASDPQTYSWQVLDCCGPLREDADDLGFVRASIQWMQDQFVIDPDAIGIAGHSDGATLTYMMAGAYPELFHFAAPVAGTSCMSNYNEVPSFTTCVETPSVPVDLLILHALDDPNMPYYGGVGPTSLRQASIKASVQDSIDLFVSPWAGVQEEPMQQLDGYEGYTYRDTGSDAVIQHLRLHGGHNWPGIDDSDAIFPYNVLVATPETPYTPWLLSAWLNSEVHPVPLA